MRSNRVVLTVLAAMGMALPAMGQCEYTELEQPDQRTDTFFGARGAVHDDLAVLTAPSYFREIAGKAYSYRLVDGTWQMEDELLSPGSAIGDMYGLGVCTDGQFIFVSAPGEENGNFTVPNGAVYVFEHDGLQWQLTDRLVSPRDDVSWDDELFGYSMALSGDLLAVGAPWAGGSEGRIELYRNDDGTWIHERTVSAPDGPRNDDAFGWTVALNGSLLAAGAARISDVAENGPGFISVFRNDGNNWLTEVVLRAPNPVRNDYVGWDLALERDRIAFSRDNPPAIFIHKRLPDGQWEMEQQIDQSMGGEMAVPTSVDQFDTGVLYLRGFDDINRSRTGAFTHTSDGWVLRHLFEPPRPCDGFDCWATALSDRPDVIFGQGADNTYAENGGAAFSTRLDNCICFADINADGTLNTLDFLDFLNAFVAAEPEADFNADDLINTLDVLAFLNAYGQGC